jgi:hypothetical protein
LSRAPRHVLRRALKDFGRAPSWPASVFAAVLVVGAGAAQSLTLDEAFDRFVERSPLAAAERDEDRHRPGKASTERYVD